MLYWNKEYLLTLFEDILLDSPCLFISSISLKPSFFHALALSYDDRDIYIKIFPPKTKVIIRMKEERRSEGLRRVEAIGEAASTYQVKIYKACSRLEEDRWKFSIDGDSSLQSTATSSYHVIISKSQHNQDIPTKLVREYSKSMPNTIDHGGMQ